MRPSRRLRWLLTSAVLAIGLWAFVLEPLRLVVRRETLRLSGWPAGLRGLRILALSDLHVGALHMSPARLDRIVARANEQQPDLVLLLGDFVATSLVGATVSPAEIGAALGRLRARHGVYAVLGNHDWWQGGAEIQRALLANGVLVLDERVLPVALPGGRLWLAGIPDETTQGPDPARLIAGAALPAGEPLFALTHDPDVFPRVPSRVALTLAGHTHGGQVRLPFFGAPIVPSRHGQRYAQGHIVEAGHDLFVTTGVGTSILPLRLGVPPELAVLTIE